MVEAQEGAEAELPIPVADRQERLRVAPGRIAALARAVLAAEGCRHPVSVAVVGDAEIAALHERFLGEPGPTDVISFPLRDEDDPEGPDDDLLGEVVVSADTAAREAAERGLAPDRELLLYVVHGTLHLLGYDDHDETDRRRMHARQEELLESFLRAEAGGAAR